MSELECGTIQGRLVGEVVEDGAHRTASDLGHLAKKGNLRMLAQSEIGLHDPEPCPIAALETAVDNVARQSDCFECLGMSDDCNQALCSLQPARRLGVPAAFGQVPSGSRGAREPPHRLPSLCSRQKNCTARVDARMALAVRECLGASRSRTSSCSSSMSRRQSAGGAYCRGRNVRPPHP